MIVYGIVYVKLIILMQFLKYNILATCGFKTRNNFIQVLQLQVYLVF